MKSFLKDFFKWFFPFSSLYVIIIILSFVKVDYYVYMPGNLTDVENEISIVDDSYDLNGSVSSVYVVTLTRPSLFEYLISRNLKYACVERMSEAEIINYDSKLDLAIGNFDSKQSFSNAELAAYSLINSDKTDYYKQVTYIYSAEKRINSSIGYTNIVGSMIKGYENNLDSYPTVSEVSAYLSSKELDDTAILYLEDKDGNNKTLEIKRSDNGNGAYNYGITIMTSYVLSIESFVDVDNVYTQGPSGGAMQALYIYLSLTNEDLLKGRNIAGTGTISYALNSEGNLYTFSKVGAIGCVEQKLYAAYIDKADVFYCPESNYEDCMKAYELYNFDELDIRVVKVSTLDDIINDLRSN